MGKDKEKMSGASARHTECQALAPGPNGQLEGETVILTFSREH